MGAQQSAAPSSSTGPTAPTGSGVPGALNRSGAVGRRNVGSAATARGAQKRNIAQLNPRQPIDAWTYDPDEATDGPVVVFSRNPLCDAAAVCEMDAVDRLLRDARIDVNAPNEEGETALHIATRRGHINLIELLLHAGARVNSIDRLGFTPLHHAVHADLAAARHLLDTHFPPINGVSMSTIHIACSNEHLLRLLLHHGADPTAAALDGSTCLHMALKLRRIPESVLLMKSSSLLLARTVNNESALHALASLQIVNLLDAGIKALFFTVRRPKADIADAASRRHQSILQGSGRNLMAIAKRLCRAASPERDALRIPVMLNRPVDAFDRMCVATEAQALHAAHLLYPHWLPSSREGSDAGVPVTVSPSQVGLLFAVPVAQRTRLPLRVLVNSDRFRHQGLLPANALADAGTSAALTDVPILCYTRARIADDERLYTADVARYSRLRMGRLLAAIVAAKLQDATARATKQPDGAVPDSTQTSESQLADATDNDGADSEDTSSSAVGGSGDVTKKRSAAGSTTLARSNVLTMDVFLELLDALDASQNIEQPDRQAQGKLHLGKLSSTLGNPVACPGPPSDDDNSSTNSDSPEKAQRNGGEAGRPSGVSPVSEAATAAAPAPLCARSSNANPRSAPFVSLRDKMNLLRGEPLGARPGDRAGAIATPTSAGLAASRSRGALVSGASFNGLIGIDPALPSLANPLDLAVTDGEHAGKTVLAMCNDTENPITNAVNEKRCVLMLLSVRAQLLLEDSFGILMSR